MGQTNKVNLDISLICIFGFTLISIALSTTIICLIFSLLKRIENIHRSQLKMLQKTRVEIREVRIMTWQNAAQSSQDLTEASGVE